MKISLKHLILLSFLFVLAPALLLLSYTDYSKAKQELEDNFEFMVDQTAENVIGAYDLVEVGFRILSLSLENKMLSAFEPFKAAYYKANGVVSDIDLPSLKSVLGDEFDLYIIDEFGVIIHTTFAKDQDLDFSKVAPSFNEKLQKIREESRYQGDRIASETVTGNVRKYAYWGTPDKKYILEIGIKSSQFEGPLKNLDLLTISSGFEDFNPELNSVIIFNGNGTVANKPDFKISDIQKKNILTVYESGDRLDIKVADKSERWVYVKADVDEVDGSASQGDKVIELIFDTSSLENQLASLASNQILITITFVIVGGIVSLLLANRISKPISSLTGSVGQIAGGNLEIYIEKNKSSKELLDLSSGISKMKDSIRDKINDIETLNTSYERFVPKEFLTLLEKDAITDVNIGDSTSLKMGVLFSDMRNFTGISEKMCVGIHIGQLVLGTIGRELRMETTVISDTVNASARLENLNKTYKTNVLISGAVRDELSPDIQSFCRLIDRTQVKGKVEFLDVYEVYLTDDVEVAAAKSKSKKVLTSIVDSYYLGDIKAAKKRLGELEDDTKKDTVISFWKNRLKT